MFASALDNHSSLIININPELNNNSIDLGLKLIFGHSKI